MEISKPAGRSQDPVLVRDREGERVTFFSLACKYRVEALEVAAYKILCSVSYNVFFLTL